MQPQSINEELKKDYFAASFYGFSQETQDIIHNFIILEVSGHQEEEFNILNFQSKILLSPTITNEINTSLFNALADYRTNPNIIVSDNWRSEFINSFSKHFANLITNYTNDDKLTPQELRSTFTTVLLNLLFNTQYISDHFTQSLNARLTKLNYKMKARINDNYEFDLHFTKIN